MNIFIREMKAYKKSLIIWCLGMVAMIGGGMGKYAGYSNYGGSMNEVLDIFPKSVLNIMGISDFDLTKAIEFYGVLFLYIILIATVHSVMIGSSIISKEERDKTTEFLFSKPVSRNKVITSKLLVAILNSIILNIVALISSFFIVGYFNKNDVLLRDIALLMSGMFIIQLMFIVIGSSIAAINKKAKRASSISTGVLLSTFMLSILINTNDGFEKLKYITPFKYFEAKSVILENSFQPVFIILSIFIIAILLIGTYGFYKKRDLSV